MSPSHGASTTLPVARSISYVYSTDSITQGGGTRQIKALTGVLDQLGRSIASGYVPTFDPSYPSSVRQGSDAPTSFTYTTWGAPQSAETVYTKPGGTETRYKLVYGYDELQRLNQVSYFIDGTFSHANPDHVPVHRVAVEKRRTRAA